MDIFDYAAEELHITRESLREALRRGAIRAEREARQRYDGAVEYQAITPQFALYQAVRAGFVSPLIFQLE